MENGRHAMGKKCRDELGGTKKTLHSWWKKSVACLLRKVDDHVKHAFRKQNREADHLANVGAEGKWKITIEGVENTETRKTVCGYWDGSTEEDGCSRCGIVIKAVNMENWITISSAAVPLETSTARTTEIAGACV